MAEAASLPLAYPEAGVVEEDSLGEQTLAVASDLPERPLVLGGCCCSHVGAIEALAARYGRIAVLWLDAHGDLNTPATSPSGNAWGMPLRMAIDAGAVDPHDVALIGARNLDTPEEEYIAASGVQTGSDAANRAVDGANGVYVALDADVLDPHEVASFMPEPGGLAVDDVEQLFSKVRERAPVLGVGLSGLRPDPRNVLPLERLVGALGL
jgi:arginase